MDAEEVLIRRGVDTIVLRDLFRSKLDGVISVELGVPRSYVTDFRRSLGLAVLPLRLSLARQMLRDGLPYDVVLKRTHVLPELLNFADVSVMVLPASVYLGEDGSDSRIPMCRANSALRRLGVRRTLLGISRQYGISYRQALMALLLLDDLDVSELARRFWEIPGWFWRYDRKPSSRPIYDLLKERLHGLELAFERPLSKMVLSQNELRVPVVVSEPGSVKVAKIQAPGLFRIKGK